MRHTLGFMLHGLHASEPLQEAVEQMGHTVASMRLLQPLGFCARLPDRMWCGQGAQTPRRCKNTRAAITEGSAQPPWVFVHLASCPLSPMTASQTHDTVQTIQTRPSPVPSGPPRSSCAARWLFQ